MAGKGFVRGNSTVHEKVKFTVSVHGRQWSSARHLQETLEEFARVIQRNARRLDFIGENDRIQRLQLARADGSEPEELDVDSTLEDVIICMGNKHLVAIVIPANSPAPCSRRREAEKLGPSSPVALPCHQLNPQGQNDSNPTSYGSLATPTSTSVPAVKETVSAGTLRLKPVPIMFRRRAATCEPPVRGLKITIPSSDPNPAAVFHHNERGKLGHDFQGEHQTVPPQPNSNSFDGLVVCKNGGPVAVMSSKSTPSPAELAHFLVKGSSLPNHRPTTGVHVIDNGNHSIYSQCLGNTTPIPGVHSFASAVLSRLPVLAPSTTGYGPAPDNIAMLAQFLASQLRAFVPENDDGVAHSPPDSNSGPHSLFNKIDSSTVGQEGVPSNANKPTETYCCHIRDKPLESSCLRNCRHSVVNGSLHNPSSADAKTEVTDSRDKDDTSSSANINMTTAATSNDCLKSENMHGRSELIFFVNRRSKTGIGAHHLKLSDLSVFFHLSVVDAAKKLGVSQTTLKKACRKFGLKRWPGRKVRSLESTIHGLEHTIAVGQGAGMEQLTEAYMRSEVTKLQQEMDQLVHGTLAQQHSPVVRTADLYKRLYSRGWRSKYHSPAFDLDLNIDSRDSELSLSSAGEKGNNNCKKMDQAAAAVGDKHDSGVILAHPLTDACDYKEEDPPDCNGGNRCQARSGGLVEDSDTNQNTSSPPVVEALGGSSEDDMGSCISRTLAGVDNGNYTRKLAKDDNKLQVVASVKDQDLLTDRSPKRPKLESQEIQCHEIKV